MLRQGIDIGGLGGALSYRRFRVVVENLPRDSAFVQSQLGESGEWSVTDYLLANITDLLAAANWQRGGNPNAPRPKPYRRPGMKQGRQLGGNKTLPLPELKAWADRWKGGTDGRE